MGICSLHFTGMAALTITPGGAVVEDGLLLGSSTLAVTVGLVSLILLLASLAATIMEQHLSQRAVQELRRIQLMSEASHEVLIIQRDWKILQINAAGTRLFGLSAAQLRGCHFPVLVHEDHRPALLRRAGLSPENRKPEEFLVRNAADQAGDKTAQG